VAAFGAELTRRGYDCLACALHPRTELRPRLEAAGIRVVCLNLPRPSILRPWRFASYVLACLTTICRLIRCEGIEIVHAHLSDAEFLGILAGRLCRVGRVLVTVHTQTPLPPRRPGDVRQGLRVRLTRFLFNRADAVVAVSRETATLLHDLFDLRLEKVQVIRNGIDTRAAAVPSGPPLPRPEGRPVLCAVGRLVAQKNQAVLFPVMARLLEDGYAPRLLVAGEGELRRALEQARDAAGLKDRVVFLGRRDDVAAVLAGCDIFLLPSLFEGTSLALLEAMAAGKPIVASDVPGNRDILRHGQTALLCPPTDAAAIAEAVRRLSDNPGLAAALGEAARHEVRKNYSIEGMTDAYIALWNAVGRR